MGRASVLLASMLGLASIAIAADCNGQPYDPAFYVCHNGNFLCPIVAGEPLSYCSGACYSTYQYTCTNNVLSQLPQQDISIPYTLTAQNPSVPAIHGKPVTGCGRKWSVGGSTCAYCPVEVVGNACPKGDYTSMSGNGAMNVMVPGGQAFYLDPYWNVEYTQAHSAYVPPGSTRTGLMAYQGGGLVNINEGSFGWVACPPRASGGGGPGWVIGARNSTTYNQERYKDCTPINLKINSLPSGTYGAWQYT